MKKDVSLNCFSIKSDRLPSEFDGYVITHVSDLHNSEFGKDNENLITVIKETNPDMIVITGDLINSRKMRIDVAVNFAKNAVLIAPCYYVTGNHESRIKEYKNLKNALIECGVTVLDDKHTSIEKNGREIDLIGIDDPCFQTGYLFGDSKTVTENKMQKLVKNTDNFKILLSHRPEFFSSFVNYNIDLVLCGHTHGGQFRIPGFRGLFAPNQGFFPKYDAGLFFEKNTNMIISRGLGNSVIPFRINNPPEIVSIKLKCK